MGFMVASGAMLSCSSGAAPCSYIVLPTNCVLTPTGAGANIMDNIPYLNVTGFATCISMANPITAAQTSAASGVLTPGTCTPMTFSPWVVGSPTIMLGNMPVLTDDSSLICSYGGTISVDYAGQTTTQV